MTPARFGPAGNGDRFKEEYHKTIDVPKFVSGFGLDAYEYQCGHGVRISRKSAEEFGQEARKCGVALSLHAPYYISLSSAEEEKRENSIGYILKASEAAHNMGAERVVVHSGSCGKMSRAEALALACDTLRRAQAAVDDAGYSEIRICPETMGKLNQLGDLDEVMELCQVDDRFLPCIDFGHLNARTFGGVNSQEAFKYVLDTIGNRLGNDRLNCFHAHFSKIEYTQKGGEKRHLTFEDTTYGPDFAPLGKLLAQKGLAPTIICESAGTQAEDALEMKSIYQLAAGKDQEGS